MKPFFKKHTTILITVAILMAVILGIGTDQFFVLRKAHSTFENYYAFRGCVQLLDKTDTAGTCRTSSGETITIVEINNKWYLQGDGPGVW